MYRQGDVLIVEAKRELRGKVQTDTVLVYGEATRPRSPRREGGSDHHGKTPQGKVIDAAKPFGVVHDEHETLAIEIPEGFYRA